MSWLNGQQLPEDLMKFHVINVGIWKGSEGVWHMEALVKQITLLVINSS